MSSILNALKKLESEKASHCPGDLKIDSDILKEGGAQRRPTATFILAAVFLFAGGSLATYLFMKPDRPKGTVKVDQKGLPATDKPARPASQPLPESAIKTEQLPETIEIVPARRSAGDKVISLPLARRPAINPKKAVTPDKLQPKQAAQASGTATAGLSPAAATPVVSNKTVPLLRVNGIAYQDGASDSMAIINGEPVANGSTVEGAKVEAIQKDRVRFNFRGEVFYIPLGKSNH